MFFYRQNHFQYFMPFVLGVADLAPGSQNEPPSAVLPFQFIERTFYFSNFFFAYIGIVHSSPNAVMYRRNHFLFRQNRRKFK